MKRPSFQWYPSDWLRDTALRTCSVGARGLWIDMLCFMHEGNPYGTLKVGNKVILPVNLASMIGATLDKTQGWLDELENAGVFDRGDNGEIMSRRMIRDENLRNIRAAGGKLGGNPALTSGKVNLKDNHKVTKEDKQKPTPSSSTSSSSPTSLVLSKDNTLSDAEEIYAIYPLKVGRKKAIEAIRKALKKASKATLLESVTAFAAARNGVKEFTPHPSTWFNEERWLDDRETWKPRSNASTGVRQPSTHATRSGYAEQEELEIPDA